MNAIIIGGSGHFHIAAEAASLDPSLHITGIAPGRREEDISALQAAFPDVPVTADAEELIARGADLAVIDPWFGDAAGYSILALEHGIHVYSEKPLATDRGMLNRLVNTWKSSGCGLAGMFNYRYYPWFLAMREAAGEGMIGEIRQIHGQKSYRMGRRAEFHTHRDTYGGLIPWVAIHAIDWALAFGGPCKALSAIHSTRENRGHGEMEVSSAILMELSWERIATVTADLFRPEGSARHDDDRLRLTGTKGMLEVIDNRVFLEDDRPRRALPLPPAGNSLLGFLNAIRSGDSDRFALDALEATSVALTARQSADLGGARLETEAIL